MHTVTINTLQTHKKNGEKFAVVTAYDASFTRLIETAGIEVILIGDSLGMVLQGHDSTLPVTLNDMIYHTASVSRASESALIIADMPFGTYTSTQQALDNAAELMRAGAHMVKMEGGEWLLETITALSQRSIPVCAHLGLTPQSVNIFGGFKVQGRDPKQANSILEDARRIEKAGASLLVLECIPRRLASEITKALAIPVIGIGAGPETDAQVLVLHDMLGITQRPPRFVKNFLSNQSSIQSALTAYNEAVKAGSFPGTEHGFE